MPPSAMDLGLPEGIPVMAGGGDASRIGIGAGSVRPGDTHVYTGASGWVSTLVKKRTLDLSAMIASVPAVRQGYFNYFAEQETAGKCLEWVKDHLALDEIHLFLNDKTIVDEPEAVYDSLYDFSVQSISTVPPGAGGVLFTPWLHGSRSPFEDPYARGVFFNLSLESGKRTTSTVACAACPPPSPINKKTARIYAIHSCLSAWLAPRIGPRLMPVLSAKNFLLTFYLGFAKTDTSVYGRRVD